MKRIIKASKPSGALKFNGKPNSESVEEIQVHGKMTASVAKANAEQWPMMHEKFKR